MNNRKQHLRFMSWTAVLCLLATESSSLPSAEYLNPDGISGTLILVGGGSVPKEVPGILKESARDQPVVVLVEASSEPKESAAAAKQWLGEHAISNIAIVDSSLPLPERHTRTVAAINGSNAVWIGGGQQSLLAATFAGSEVEQALVRLLQRDGTIAGTSAGAAIMSKVMIASGKDEPEISTGWNLLPGVIIDQHFTERSRISRLMIAVNRHPSRFGIGVDEGTAIIVSRRRMQVAGQGGASIILANAAYRDAEIIHLAAGDTGDLTQLRRAAEQRSRGNNPGSPTNGLPHVAKGSLVIVGGGSMPRQITERFIELAGGRKARIVVLPTAMPRAETTDEVPRFLKQETVESMILLTQRGKEVEREEFRLALKSATGIWFGGGRQWNFVDCYEGTAAIELFHDVLRRGGVIGGSSAGATIQGEFLVRGHPLGNTVMMAEGYERGFSFLPGVAIDQHFAQRARQPDLLPVIRQHPELLGIGIDEGTAIVVTGSKAEVIGLHSAHFVSAKQLASIPADEELPTTTEGSAKVYVSVKSGESIDLRSP